MYNHYRAVILILASNNNNIYKNCRAIWKKYMNRDPTIKVFFVYGKLIDKLTHHKQVSEEILKREVELAINDSILPPQAITLMNKMGQFGPLTSVIKDEMAYKRYLEKAKVDPKDCYTYFFEKNGMDVFVIAEWNEDHFRFLRIKNLKVLLH